MASLSNYCFFYVIILVALFLSNPIDCTNEVQVQVPEQEQVNEKAPKLLLVFGDTHFDPGNNQFFNPTEKTRQTSSWPYGVDLTNKQATGRESDGWIVPDFIALSREVPMLQPYLQPEVDLTNGANFASAGSGCLDIHPGVMNLKMQIDNFKKFANSLKEKLTEPKAMDELKGSVCLLSFGANDYFKFNTDHPQATEPERTQYVNMVIDNLTAGLKEIYTMGGRKFAFQNVGPLGCLPMIKQMYPQLNGSCHNELQNLANMHNTALSNKLKELSFQLADFKYSIFDFNFALTDYINNPSKYGFTEGKIACCGTGQFNGENCGWKEQYNLCQEPSDYVFFDGGYTSQRANSQFADLFWSGDPKITAPLNVKQLFEMP